VTGQGRDSLSSVAVPFIVFTLIWGSTWIVIRDQLGIVPAQWSVTYRFAIAAVAMAAVARWKGQRLPLAGGGLAAALVIAITQFCINFNSVYFAEHFITSGVVATVFALLLIPNSLLAWVWLGQKPTVRFAIGSAIAAAGIALLFVHEIRASPASAAEVATGLGFTLLGLLGASIANVYQARERVRALPLFSLLAWSMGLGALFDALFALAFVGAPVFDSRPGYWLGLVYLALFASVLCFSLYFPVVRKIGPGRAAYSSVLVPIIAMGFSTWFEGYRWTPLAAAGALLALGGMLLALVGRRRPQLVAAPDAG
jgi:drug/metabolite transporter (DMT)-like permease